MTSAEAEAEAEAEAAMIDRERRKATTDAYVAGYLEGQVDLWDEDPSVPPRFRVINTGSER